MAPTTRATSSSTAPIEIPEITTDTVEVAIIGRTPLILNRISEKARHEFTLPSGRKTAAEKASTPKHDLLAEFRASPYMLIDPEAPTLLAIPAAAPKKAMMTAALEVPGARKAQIGRLVTVLGEYLPVYGVPKMIVSIVRDADMNRTPNVRARVIIPRWTVIVPIRFLVGALNPASIVRLLNAAGTVSGIGDWRAEKGAGDYGSFEIAMPGDPEVEAIIAEGGRAAQQAAMDEPQPYDPETSDILSWFTREVARRGLSTS